MLCLGTRVVASGVMLGLVVGGVVVGAGAPVAASASGSHTFLVDDVRDLADKSPGDGKCETEKTDGPRAGQPTCSLWAAIQEANALPEGETATITAAPLIRQLDGSFAETGEVDMIWNATNNPENLSPMLSGAALQSATGIGAPISNENAARYQIKHDGVTVDLQNRVNIVSSSNPSQGQSVFVVTGKNVALRNFSLSGPQTGVYVSATAANTLVEDMVIGNPASTPATESDNALERGVIVVAGAKNTTIRGVTFSRVADSAVVLMQSSKADQVIDGLMIDGNTWQQPANGGGNDPARNVFVTTGQLGAGVGTNGDPADSSVSLSGVNVTVQNNRILDWANDGGKGGQMVNFAGGADATGGGSYWTNLKILSNHFESQKPLEGVAVWLRGLGSSNKTNILLRGNVFAYTGSAPMPNAINRSWVRTYDGTLHASVQDNQFIGGKNVLQIILTGVGGSNLKASEPVFRNTMSGVGIGAQDALNEKNLASAGVPVEQSNQIWQTASNNRLVPVWPSKAEVTDACMVDVRLEKPDEYASSAAYGLGSASKNLYVDVYAGLGAAQGGDDAGLEQYLGRVAVNANELPKTVSVPYSGAGDGNQLRLQTMEADTQWTSTISRRVTMTGVDACGPLMWIKRGGWFNDQGVVSATQENPTSTREVKFEIRSSEVLGSNKISAEDIVFTGTAPDQQVVSLTQISDTSWSLVAKANGSGTIVPMIPAGVVNDLHDLPNTASNTTVAPIDFAGSKDIPQTAGIAGKDIDHTVEYVSPLSVKDADALQRTVAEPDLVSEPVTVVASKVPTDPVVLKQQWSDLVPDPAFPNPGQNADGVAKVLPTHPHLNDSEAVLVSTESERDVTIAPIANDIIAGTRKVKLGFTVESGDPNFDGLLLPSVAVTVLDHHTVPAVSGDPVSGKVGEAYSFTFTATGEGSVRVELASGDLPDGLALSEDGVLSGTPTAEGTFVFGVKATNGSGVSPVHDVTITVDALDSGDSGDTGGIDGEGEKTAEAAPAITSGLPPGGQIGAAYTYTVTSTGFPQPTYSVTAGALPEGLSLDEVTGNISGKPLQAGAYELVLRAENGVGEPANLPATLVIQDEPGVLAMVLERPSVEHEMGAKLPSTTSDWVALFGANLNVDGKTISPVWTVDATQVDATVPNENGYEVRLSVSDSLKRVATATGRVVVRDTTAPVVTASTQQLKHAMRMPLAQWTTAEWVALFGMTATDDGGTGVDASTWKVAQEVNFTSAGQYRVDFSVADLAGNESRATSVTLVIQAPPRDSSVEMDVAQNQGVSLDPIARSRSEGTLQRLDSASLGTPSHGAAFEINGTGAVYVPARNYHGAETAEVTVADDLGQTAVVRYTFNVLKQCSLVESREPEYTIQPGEELEIPEKDVLGAVAGANVQLAGFSTPGGFVGSVKRKGAVLKFVPGKNTSVGTERFTALVQDRVGQLARVPVTIHVVAEKSSARTAAVSKEQRAAVTDNPVSTQSEPSQQTIKSIASKTQPTTSVPQGAKLAGTGSLHAPSALILSLGLLILSGIVLFHKHRLERTAGEE